MPAKTTRRQCHRNYVNIQERWVNGVGQRNTVLIRNGGPATKVAEKIGRNGRVLSKKTRKLSAKEKAAILDGTFVNGLWGNCRV